ncbi:hypothetical protein Fcan01_25989 [Folsomia candida]|uniref:Transposase domain-containing protein n=1 Tax=Folsomia candida TaxID=158441 RepID=A0A226D0Y2_FOLCA|nr:hypothetical protein Fcan01_25989 [Folsomia candida]
MPKDITTLSKRQLNRHVQNRVTTILSTIKTSRVHKQEIVKNPEEVIVGDSSSEVFNSDTFNCHFDELPIYLSDCDSDSDSEGENYDSGENNCDSNEEENCDTEVELLKQQLNQWSNKHVISQCATSELLKLLKKHNCFTSLPSDSRTLKGTRRHFNVKPIPPGEYVHLGLSNGIQNYLNRVKPQETKVEILVNIDGIPISKSSKSELWPILCAVREKQFKQHPFCVGVYHGPAKPKDHNLFLFEFVEECNNLIRNGYKYGNIVYEIKIAGFVCDAPARAFITCTKYHSGFSACSKCNQIGERYLNRTIFSTSSGSLRKDADFLSVEDDDDHHRGKTILVNLNVGLVSKVPYEYMHLICLGVTRKLLNLWTSGPPNYLKFSGSLINDISAALLKQQKFVPCDFNRKPRALDELPRWKATEYRFFILYVGPVILENKIPEPYYQHFLALHVAVQIFSSDDLIKKYGDYADKRMQYFVQNFSVLYGKENLSYNCILFGKLLGESEEFDKGWKSSIGPGLWKNIRAGAVPRAWKERGVSTNSLLHFNPEES